VSLFAIAQIGKANLATRGGITSFYKNMKRVGMVVK